jgi:hypothetical protein
MAITTPTKIAIMAVFRRGEGHAIMNDLLETLSVCSHILWSHTAVVLILSTATIFEV